MDPRIREDDGECSQGLLKNGLRPSLLRQKQFAP